MVRLVFGISLLCLFSVPGLAADAVAPIISKARVTCESYENGVFDQGKAVSKIDLTDDGTLDTVIDESDFRCSSSKSLYCGTGGCMLHAIVDDEVWSFQAEGWRMIDWDGRPILLIARDGGWCGGAGAQVCYEAVVWSHGKMLTVMPQAR
jgi:hypothetical protein